jgi:regulator of cell morphogenesis and NO signaling
MKISKSNIKRQPTHIEPGNRWFFREAGIEVLARDEKFTTDKAGEVDGPVLLEMDSAGIREVEREGVDYFSMWDLNTLMDYIVNTHHRFAKENAVVIFDLVQQISYHQGGQAELAKLSEKLFLFFNDLLNHIKKEEQILFPNIRQLVKKKNNTGDGSYTSFGMINESVRMMQEEHSSADRDLAFIRKLTNDYTLPSEAPEPQVCLYEKLRQFEDDLALHVDLENNILFPRAAALDEQ